MLVAAGLDPFGYSGLLADTRHLAALGTRAFGVVTCTTLQTVDRVLEVRSVDPDHVARAIRLALASGIRAVKIGLTAHAPVVQALADALAATDLPIVLDPVLAAGGGDELVEAATLEALRRHLVPLAHVLTPNLPEAQRLAPGAGDPVVALRAAGARWVLLKGGHGSDPACVEDRLVGPDGTHLQVSPRVPGPTPRGTGCALSSLLADGLARGLGVPEATVRARELVAGGIRRAADAGTRWLEISGPS